MLRIGVMSLLPEPVEEPHLVRLQGGDDHANMLRLGREQVLVQRLDLGAVDREQGHPDGELLQRIGSAIGSSCRLTQKRVDPATIWAHLVNHTRQFDDLRVKETVDEGDRLVAAIELQSSIVQPERQTGNCSQTQAVVDGRPPHHLLLRHRPVARPSPPADLQTLPQRGELTIFGPHAPHASPIGQQQFGTASPGFLLPADEPLPQRGHQKIMRELIRDVRVCISWRVARRLLEAIGYDRRDEPQLAVEHVPQVGKILRAFFIAGGGDQLTQRPATSDHRVIVGEQALQHIAGCLLVVSIPGRGIGLAKRLLEERDAHAGRTADFFQRRGRPILVLQHLGKKRQPHRHDFPVDRQARHGISDEMPLFFGHRDGIIGKPAIGPPEQRQHFGGVLDVEEIEHRGVDPLDQANIQHVAHEPVHRRPKLVPHHDKTLRVNAVALPQCGRELTVAGRFIDLQPLLELIDDDQHLPALRHQRTTPQHRERTGQGAALRDLREAGLEPLEQQRFGIVPRGFDEDEDDGGREPW